MKYRDLLLVKSLLLALVLAILGGVSPALAQTVTGSLSGTVTDEQKAVLAGVEVRLKNEATGVEASGTTNENGNYRFPALQPGVYSLSVKAEGFKTAEVTQVGVKLGVEVSLDVLMQVGGGGEIVEIVGGEAVIERENSQISANYDARKVSELPNSVAGGGIDTIALLTPGVVAPDDASFSNSSGTNISSNGGRGRSNNFTIDGQDNNDISVAGPAVSVDNTDAVQEFQIVTNNFSAEYGQSSGAIVNLITKGGTNDFHGTVGYFYRNRKLFDSLTTLERRSGKKEADPLLNNTFSYSIGGPIKKDKVFFFYSFQGIREASSTFVQSGIGAVTPTPRGIQALMAISAPNIANVIRLAAPFNQAIGNPVIQTDNNGNPITRIITISGVLVEFGAI